MFGRSIEVTILGPEAVVLAERKYEVGSVLFFSGAFIELEGIGFYESGTTIEDSPIPVLSGGYFG